MTELIEDFIHTKHGYCYYEYEQGRVPIIYNLYVHPEYRRTGKARELLSYVIVQIRSLGYTGEINIEALPREESVSRDDLVAFYESMGLNIIENSPVNELAVKIERLQAKNEKLRSQRDKLIEMGNKCTKKFIGWFDISIWKNAVDEITAEEK